MEPVSSLIPTIDGFKAMGDVVVGDKVFGSDGKVCNVLKTFDHMDKDIYRVHFNDESFIDCGLEHLWKVRTSNMRYRNKGWMVLSTAEILNRGLFYSSSYRDRNGYKPRYKWEIPVTEPVQYSEKGYFIHPYILGVCIGDGSMCGGTVTISIPNFEIETSERVLRYLNSEYTLTRNDSASCPRYMIVKREYSRYNAYIREIARLGLNVKGCDKFIPKEYLLGSVEQRLDLLRGLMDSDGTISKGNKVSYSTTSSQLADDVVSLVNSLGGLAKKHIYDRTSKGKSLEYVVTINMVLNPFYLDRKASKFTKTTTRCCHRYITGIEYNRREDAKCLAVDSYDNTYLTSNRYVVTHNTLQMIYLAEILKKREGLKHCFIICGVNGLKYN